METKIIVLTPVKNESWILDRFLSVTSLFADLIIVADQNSTDGSSDVCKKYDKVHLVKNESTKYSESSRQILLIETARNLMPNVKRILLALDADEILSANSLNSIGWQTMLKANPGTVLYFEKPDLYLTPYNAIRNNTLWPLGYIDDNVEHKPTEIHSVRIPHPPYAMKLFINDVKFMHYALIRIDAYKLKQMYYSMVENILRKNNFLVRRRVYSPKLNYSKNLLGITPLEWFEGWEKIGIDMTSVFSESNYWYEDAALKLFAEHGYKRFWFDPIWNKDWNNNQDSLEIKRPPYLLIKSLSIIDKLFF